MMITRTLTPLLVLLAVAGCSQSVREPEPPAAAKLEVAGPTAGATGGIVVVQATVESVNRQTREVVLKTADGETMEIVAGPEVRNLDQVRRGDIVEIEDVEALALELQEQQTGIRERVEATSGSRAEAGDKPAVSTSRRIEAIASVVGIDKQKRLVVLQGPTQTVTVKVGDQVDLDSLQEGDEVKATYIKEVAISVRKP